MTLPATLLGPVLETILIRLTALFLTGAGGDIAAARQAALQMLAAHHPETQDELALAANIVCFGFQALEALSQTAAPDLPLTRVLRLRGSAVSLSREAEKARRSLDRARKARHQAAAAEAEPPPAETPAAETPAAGTGAVRRDVPAVKTNANSVNAAAKAQGLTWTQAYQQRQRQARLAASQKKAQARLTNASNPAVPRAQAV